MIALVFMALILIASMELRVQSMRTGSDVAVTCRAVRPIEALSTMLVERALPRPERDAVTGLLTWRGEYQDEPYVIVRMPEDVANPLVSAEREGVDEAVPTTLRLWRYTITCAGVEKSFLWHR